jgi:hypothetical protein
MSDDEIIRNVPNSCYFYCNRFNSDISNNQNNLLKYSIELGIKKGKLVLENCLCSFDNRLYNLV